MVHASASPNSTEVLTFDDFELRRATRELYVRGQSVPLQPKVYELLCVLIDHSDRVLTKQELLGRLWANEVVGEDVLTTAMRGLRKALGESARTSRFVRTVRGIGYQFAAPVVRGPIARPRPPSPAAEARHQSFVGRSAQLDTMQRMLAVADPTPRLCFLHGPGGIGKTSLLQEIAYRFRAQGCACVELHAEHLAARPEQFDASVMSALHEAIDSRTLSTASPALLLIDGFDALVGLGKWLLEVFLPRLPSHTIVVLASRSAPNKRWRADAAWAAMAVEVEIPPFSPEESNRFLAERRVDPSAYEGILRFSGGHPLALALAVAAVERGVRTSELPHDRAVIDALVDAFADTVPSPKHRAALEAASIVSTLDTALLAAIMEVDDASDFYAWLARLPFVSELMSSLQVHRLVRDAIVAQLSWRNPIRLRRLAAASYAAHLQALREAPDLSTRLSLTTRLMSTGRYHPKISQFYIYDDRADVTVELAPVKAAWAETLASMVERYEGAPSAELLRRWIASDAGDLWLVRDDSEVPAGFGLVLSLNRLQLDGHRWDPVVTSIADHLRRTGCLPEDADIVIYRYMVGRDEYQALGMVMQRLHEVMNYDTHNIPAMPRRISHSFIVYGDDRTWGPVASFSEFERVEIDVPSPSGLEFAVFGHSWETQPFHEWTNAMVGKLAATHPV